MHDKVILITRKTRLQELIERFNTKAQAKFYIEHAGANFADYEEEDFEYQRSLELVSKQIDESLKFQMIDRRFVPNFVFSETDLVVALGQDGLVANVAKYAANRPIIGVNPDPKRIDGLLVPVAVKDFHHAVESIINQQAQMKHVTLAEVKTNDGQRLLAFNDLFIGAQTHVSARYRLRYDNCAEEQSSSGIIVSTGAGSTGWLSSLFNMASGLSSFSGGEACQPIVMPWDSRTLVFVVREPFASKHSQIGLVAGLLENNNTLEIESRMPSGGTIFSDGIEADFIRFSSGMTATVQAAPEQAMLYMPPQTAAKPQRKILALSARRP